MTDSLDDYRWLTGDAAGAWLDRAALELASGQSLTRLALRLRKELSPARTHLVLQQVELRIRAREKFARAEEMFFTPLGLAQGTDEPLARYKAAQLEAGDRVVDLCCGIGGDLIALGQERECLGIDRDPVAAHLAAANAAVCGLASVKVECRDAAADALAGCTAWHIDPDRRPDGKRTVRAERFEPSWETVEGLLGRCPNGIVKVAPATELSADVAARCRREWIESRGECRQQVAWFGRFCTPGGESAATVVDAAGGSATIGGLYDEPPPVADAVGTFVYEPSAAVRAARLTAALCKRWEVAAISGSRSYLTGPRPIDDPLMSGFEVLEAIPFDLRRLASALTRLDVEPVEIKKRGIEVDPAKLRQKLQGERGQPGVVLVAPVAGRTTAIIARRLRWPR